MIKRPRRATRTPVATPTGPTAPKEPTSAPRTVTIIDDGLVDSVVLGAVDDIDGDPTSPPPARTAMDPRIRARRREVRRTQGRRRRRVLGIIAAVLLVILVALVLLVSPVLSVRTVQVDGDVYSRRFDGDRLDRVVASLKGEPILSADLAAVRDELEASPWIRSVRVTRDLPGRVVIELDERQPLAWFMGGDARFRVIDGDGAVIAVLEGQPIDYLGITGTAPDLEPGQFAPAPYRAAAQLIRSLPDEVGDLVTALAVSDLGELSMTLAPGAEVRFGLPDDLQGKLVALVVVMRRQDVAELTTIDLSSGQPTVR